MEKIKRLINCILSDTVCNLRCHYCYVGQQKKHVQKSLDNIHSVEEIRKALSYKRLGGRCHMNLCAVGETLLAKEIISLVEAFLEENHIVTIVTNCIARNKIKEILNLPYDLTDRLFFKISFHYLELKRKGLLDFFWKNVNMIKNAGVSFTVELTVNDESTLYIDEIQKECMNNIGSLCHVIESRRQDGKNWPRLTKLEVDEHKQHWERFKSPLFNFQQTIWSVKREEFCYAGDWIASVDLKSGILTPCFGGGRVLDNIYSDITKPIRFNAIGAKCPWGHCYAAYVLLTHGAIPDFKAPFYAEERNRVDTNGNEWLNGTIKKVFSSRLSETNSEYSDKRKIITNYVMGNVYCNFCDSDIKLVKEVIQDYLNKNNYKDIAIYGAGVLGIKLYETLKSMNIDIKYFIDKNYQSLTAPISCRSNCDNYDDVDLIIVTAYGWLNEIYNDICNRTSAEIISILDMYCEE